MSRKTTRAQDSVRDQLLRIETLIQSSARARSPSTANPQQMLPIQSDHTFPQELPSVDNNQPDPTEARHDMSLDSVAPSDFTRQTRGSSSVPTTASMLAPSIQSAPLYSPNTGHHSIGTAVPVSPFQGTLIANSDHVESVSHDNEDNEDNEDSQDKVTSRARISEYHGPGSWLSICSEAGMAWTIERTGCSDFAASAQRLAMAWNRSWRTAYPCTPANSDEPDVETAWRYTSAFFDHCFEAILGIVHRPEFEARLRAHFEQGPDPPAKDTAWYALRNTVYASGCRQLLLKNRSMPFAEAQAHAFQYFDRALRVHTELIYGPPTLEAVRALTAMAYYAEGVGNQSFEYTMCANAVCLAHATGLHRQSSRTLHLSPVEKLHRNWLFWAIYCCEKQVSFRSGRPSFIDDASVSCEIPDQAPPGSMINVLFFQHAIKMNQLTSQIDCRLASVGALRQDASEYIRAANEISEQLESWRDSMNEVWGVGRPVRPEHLPANVQPLHVMYLHYSYYAGIQAVFTVFTCPWLSAILKIDKDARFRQQVTSRVNQVAQAARGLILIFKSMELDAGLPPWATFYFPMSALANLFIFLLTSPTSPSAQADIALLDIAAGHFSHMEYLTSLELGAPFARGAAHLARKAVDKAKQPALPCTSPNAPQDGSEPDPNAILLPQGGLLPTLSSRTFSDNASRPDLFDPVEFDYEGWNLYSMDVTNDWATGSDILDFSRFSQP